MRSQRHLWNSKRQDCSHRQPEMRGSSSQRQTVQAVWPLSTRSRVSIAMGTDPADKTGKKRRAKDGQEGRKTEDERRGKRAGEKWTVRRRRSHGGSALQEGSKEGAGRESVQKSSGIARSPKLPLMLHLLSYFTNKVGRLPPLRESTALENSRPRDVLSPVSRGFSALVTLLAVTCSCCPIVVALLLGALTRRRAVAATRRLINPIANRKARAVA